MIIIIMIAHVIWLLYMISFTMCYQRLSNHNNVDDKPTHSPHLLYGHRWTEPYFDVTMPRNITSLVGKSAYLGCRVKNLGNKTVAWIRHRDLHILTVGTYTYTTDQRFQTTFHRDIEEWTLQIKWAQKRDAGTYECQISTQPVRSFSVDLDIVDHISEEKTDLLHQFFNDDAFYINSDRVYQGQDDEFANLYGPIQKVTVPTATILGGPDLYVDKGSTINLTCAIKFSPEPPTHIFWYHQDKVIGEDHSRGRISFMATKGEGARSILRIEDADITDSGKYSCFPSNTDMASIRVHVLNGERPEAMQTSGSSSLLYAFDIRKYHLRYYNNNYNNNNNNNNLYHQQNKFYSFISFIIFIFICSQLNFYSNLFILLNYFYKKFYNMIFIKFNLQNLIRR